MPATDRDNPPANPSFDVCTCGHPREEHHGLNSGDWCRGEVSVQNPNIPDFRSCCVCSTFDLWYRDGELEEAHNGR